MRTQKDITEYIQLQINKYNDKGQKYPYIDLVYNLQEFCKDLQKEAVEEVSNRNSILERAFEWICKGEVGASSKTILFHFMGMEGFNVDYPYDNSDFRRCYLLLEKFPEWKSEMHQMKKYNRVWSNLADEWENLSELYEKYCISNFYNDRDKLEKDMYDLIKKCREISSDSTDDLSGICE